MEFQKLKNEINEFEIPDLLKEAGDNTNSKFRKKDYINSQTHCFIHVIDAPSADNDDEIIIFKKFLDQIKKELGIFIIISLFSFFRNIIICSVDKT